MKIADETEQQMAALALMNALHAEGFTQLWIDSVMMFSGSLLPGESQIAHHVARVVVDEVEIHADRYANLVAVVERHGGNLGLHEISMNQQRFSRLAVWPAHGR